MRFVALWPLPTAVLRVGGAHHEHRAAIEPARLGVRVVVRGALLAVGAFGPQLEAVLRFQDGACRISHVVARYAA